MNSTLKASISALVVLVGLGWLGVRLVCIKGPDIVHKSGVTLSFSEVYSSQCGK